MSTISTTSTDATTGNVTPDAPNVETFVYPWSDMPAIGVAVSYQRNTLHRHGVNPATPDARPASASRGEHVAVRHYITTHNVDGTPRDPSIPVTRDHIAAHAAMSVAAMRRAACTPYGGTCDASALRPLSQRVAAAVGPDGTVNGTRNGWIAGRWIAGTLVAWVHAIDAANRAANRAANNNA